MKIIKYAVFILFLLLPIGCSSNLPPVEEQFVWVGSCPALLRVGEQFKLIYIDVRFFAEQNTLEVSGVFFGNFESIFLDFSEREKIINNIEQNELIYVRGKSYFELKNEDVSIYFTGLQLQIFLSYLDQKRLEELVENPAQESEMPFDIQTDF